MPTVHGDGLTPSQKAWVDEASYETLLRRWRFSPMDDVCFQGEQCVYFTRVMLDKRRHCDYEAISKKVGWDKPCHYHTNY